MTKRILEKVLGPNEEIKYQFSLGERYLKIKKVLTISLGTLLLMIIGALISFTFEISAIIVVLIMIGLLALLVLFSFLYFGWYLRIANVYIFTNRRIVIHKGWLSTRLVSVNFRQITDIKVIQLFVDKVIYGTGALKIDTAGMGIKGHSITLFRIENPYAIKRKLIEIKNSCLRHQTQ